MSSPRLQPRPAPDAAAQGEPLRAALSEVAASSFFAYVEEIDDEAFGEMAGSSPRWLHVTVRFDGSFGGALQIGLSEPLALELYQAFLGLEPGNTPEDAALFDLVGEFGNMVCGLWLTRACQPGSFGLQPPTVRRAGSEQPLADGIRVLVNGHPAHLRLAFGEA